MTRTFKVEVEVKDAKATPIAAVYPITFNEPASTGPEKTLKAIAVNRVEAQFYASPTFKTLGKNWTIKRVFECCDNAGPAEPGTRGTNGEN